MIELEASHARRVALWRQGLLAGGRQSGSAVSQVRSMVHDLGAVQLDTISVLARSHELVAYSRFGAIDRSDVEAAYWDDNAAFEYWSHAACILPMSSWPNFAFRRREYVRRGCTWKDAPSTKALRAVRQRLASDGPLTVTQLGGARKSSDWWDWSESKNAVEWLLTIGEVVCTSRTGWRRVYDLAERAVPEPLRVHSGWIDDEGVVGPSDEQCLVALIRDAAHTIGVGTAGDIADVHRLPVSFVARHAEEAGLQRVTVRGWSGSAWATQQALDWIASAPRVRSRTTLLSPFDSLIWHRERVERLFGMTHRLEAYTPSHARVHGYFAMPVLHRGELVARVDPKREKSTLVAGRVTFVENARGNVPPAAVAGTATALWEAATWVGADAIRVDSVVPSALAAPLRAALR